MNLTNWPVYNVEIPDLSDFIFKNPVRLSEKKTVEIVKRLISATMTD